MLFSRRKNKKERELDSNKSQFAASFTENQKKAVFRSLWMIATSDSKLGLDELKLLGVVSTFLDYDGVSDENMDQIMNIDHSTVINYLNSLNTDQKEWYVTTVYTMVYADNKVNTKEVNLLTEYTTGMGISPQLFEEIVVKQSEIIKQNQLK